MDRWPSSLSMAESSYRYAWSKAYVSSRTLGSVWMISGHSWVPIVMAFTTCCGRRAGETSGRFTSERTHRNRPATPRATASEETRDSHRPGRSEEHTSELQSLMRISYAVFCLKKQNTKHTQTQQQAEKAHTKT